MNILVTGGAGYIASHTIVELLNDGHNVVAVDNLCNSSKVSLERVEKLTNKKIVFYECDIRDKACLFDMLKSHTFDCCIHFAGLKAVGESVQKPWEYYNNNVEGTLTLIDVLRKNNCKNIIFSSSATVYGEPETIPISEKHIKKRCSNPYGQTKSMVEDILEDMYHADIKTQDVDPWNIVVLRYFNPIGAHPSGLIGENPNGIPNNLMPFITQVAVGKLKQLSVFGNDYDTHDGTGVRDYIHVVDLAKGHVKALKAIENKCGYKIYNLGTGNGYSVLDLVKSFEKVNNLSIPYEIVDRRPGDIAACYADPQKAFEELGWKAELDLESMCRDSWNWQKNNPNGY